VGGSSQCWQALRISVVSLVQKTYIHFSRSILSNPEAYTQSHPHFLLLCLLELSFLLFQFTSAERERAKEREFPKGNTLERHLLKTFSAAFAVQVCLVAAIETSWQLFHPTTTSVRLLLVPRRLKTFSHHNGLDCPVFYRLRPTIGHCNTRSRLTPTSLLTRFQWKVVFLCFISSKELLWRKEIADVAK